MQQTEKIPSSNENAPKYEWPICSLDKFDLWLAIPSISLPIRFYLGARRYCATRIIFSYTTVMVLNRKVQLSLRYSAQQSTQKEKILRVVGLNSQMASFLLLFHLE